MIHGQIVAAPLIEMQWSGNQFGRDCASGRE